MLNARARAKIPGTGQTTGEVGSPVRTKVRYFFKYIHRMVLISK